FAAAFEQSQVDFAALRDAVAGHMLGLRGLQTLSGAPICTAPIDRIVDTALEFGLAAKPSGAGGGDMVVIFAPSGAALDQLAVALRQRFGIARLGDVQAHAEGLRAETQPPLCARLPGVFRLSVPQRRQRFERARGTSTPDATSYADVGPSALGLDA